MMKKSIALSAISIENLKSPNCQTLFTKHSLFVLFVISSAVKIKKYFKEEESIEILKVFGLINNTEGYQMNI